MKRFHFSLLASLLLAAPLLAEPKTPQPPLADAGPDKIVMGESVCLLQGEASDTDSDTKKTPLVVKWEQLRGPAPARLAQPANPRCALADLQAG